MNSFYNNNLDLNLTYACKLFSFRFEFEIPKKTITCKKGNQEKDFIRNYEKERRRMLVVLECLGQWSLR